MPAAFSLPSKLALFLVWREALIEKDRALRTFVLDRLAEAWTPEQISGWLKAGNERHLRAVGCERRTFWSIAAVCCELFLGHQFGHSIGIYGIILLIALSFTAYLLPDMGRNMPYNVHDSLE
jgi:hypothetical protein